jgi:RNA polymerase sigma factor (TIGR02999 family)
MTQLLEDVQSGKRGAVERLFPIVYDELHELAKRYMRRERVGHTLQPTALVHEAFMQLVDESRVNWQGKTHFVAAGARAMRRILLDHARKHLAAKRGGKLRRMTLDEELIADADQHDDLIALGEALDKLEQLDPRQAQMVELRFFGGMSVAEVAAVLGMSKRSAEREWTMIRAWLRREFGETATS